jgi:hypothetical protein
LRRIYVRQIDELIVTAPPFWLTCLHYARFFSAAMTGLLRVPACPIYSQYDGQAKCHVHYE